MLGTDQSLTNAGKDHYVDRQIMVNANVTSNLALLEIGYYK